MSKKKLSKFERDLLKSVHQAEQGEAAATHTPDAIAFKLMLDDTAARQYVCSAINAGDEPAILAALRHAIYARGLAQLAAASGLERQALHDALRPGAEPSFDTILRVFDGLGLRMKATAAEAARKPA